MSICKIGEKKEIGEKWYQKTEPRKEGLCHGCAFYENWEVSHMCSGDFEIVNKPLELGGRECECSIWVACDPPKPAKKPAPAKWAPVNLFAPLPKRCSQEGWALALAAAQNQINKLGAENAKLKNKLAKGVR